MNSAVSELTGSRLRSVIKAKALSINKILMSAMDDVQSQFCGGMRQLSTPALTASLSADEISTLCTSAVVAVRTVLDADYVTSLLEKQLEERINPRQTTTQLTPLSRDSSVPTPDADALGWLRAFMLGSTALDLPADVNHFLLVEVSRYLDPFLDGDVPPSECIKRSEGFFVTRLQAAWAKEHGEGSEMPVPGHFAYAQYLSHALTKLNANHGFGAHIPGLGRQPVGKLEQEHYMKAMCTSLINATERDFEPAHRVIGTYKSLAAADLQAISREHLEGLYLYHNELGNALANANREGEEARRKERMRIWGYA